MESYSIKNLTFSYPGRAIPVLKGISLDIGKGEFVTLCGKSGCGKTTLLRLLKTVLAPFGELEGAIYFCGKPLSEHGQREQASEIGFVMQNPDSQIVTDKVWHELAFGLESLGIPTQEIRARVAEMASFFGIQTWFHKNVTELSGGQKQLLNLASVMVMQPSVLILDEPTSQLDPIASQEFLKNLEKINRELGTTVILTEHRLEDAFPVSDRVIVMDSGRIIADGSPSRVGEILRSTEHDMYSALPVPMRVHGAVSDGSECPVTVREGKGWLERYAEKHPLFPDAIPEGGRQESYGDTVIEVKDAYFRYGRDLPDVIKGLNLTVRKGELFAILGGNGTGKTTALSLISGLHTPYRGKVLINGRAPSEIKGLYGGILGVLPQNPQTLFVKKTVYLDLLEAFPDKKIPPSEAERRIRGTAELCRISELLESHPYDLSGGEQQRAALAKVLLMSPQLLLLDEPTKGMDAHFKGIFADIIKELCKKGVTVVAVSHDVEFCAEYADSCAMFFDGCIASVGAPRQFFAGKSFYTTSANRMARALIPKAVLADDIILACGKKAPEKRKNDTPAYVYVNEEKNAAPEKKVKRAALKPSRMVAGSIFSLLFLFSCIMLCGGSSFAPGLLFGKAGEAILQLSAMAGIAGVLICFLPGRELGTVTAQQLQMNRRLDKRTVAAAFLILFAIPLTIYVGVFLLEDTKYYLVSLLIILETVIPFVMVFEHRKPEARELVIISVLCAIAVAGRAAFFMVPQFKPVAAIIIISGVCFGGEAGFLVGAVTGFISNFFFGQGPWAPWQMFAFGIIGFLAGVLFRKGFLKKTRASLCIFGGLAVLIIYGGIMNPASVLMSQQKLNAGTVLSAYAMGLPFDIVHAASTVFFLWFISEPMIEKLERIKVKYGLIQGEVQ